MAQHPHNGAPVPLPDLRQLQAFHLQLDRDTAALQSEVAELQNYWAYWFPARQDQHLAAYYMQITQMRVESDTRRWEAIPWNIPYWITGKGQARSTGYQEEMFLLRSQTMQYQQLLRTIEQDRSTLERMGANLALKRARIASDWQWLQGKYQLLGYTLAIPPIP